MSTRKTRDVMLYWTDRILRSPQSQLVALALLVVVVVFAGAALMIAAGSPGGWQDNLWNAWSKITGLERLEAGSGPALLLVTTLLTLVQWFIFGFVVSMIGSWVTQRLSTIRKGATHILDRGHTVILGWNDTIYSILDLLHSEDEGARRGAVAVLAHMDKDEMESRIAKYCRSPLAGRTLCRTGMIDSIPDLQRVNLREARDILVLGEEAESDRLLDGHVLRAFLACGQALAGDSVPANALVGHRLLHTGQLITRLGMQWKHLQVSPVHMPSILAKLVAQCAWQPGLAAVYRDLLTYSSSATTVEGQPSSEIYCVSTKEAAIPDGTSFEQVFWGLPHATAIGYLGGGKLVLNPVGLETTYQLQQGDSVVVLAGARASVSYRAAAPIVAQAFAEASPHSAKRSVLLVGRGPQAHTVLSDLVRYLPPGSTVGSTEPGAVPQAPVSAGLQPVQVSQLDVDDLSVLPEDELRPMVAQFDTIVITSAERAREVHDTAMLTQISAVFAACEGNSHCPVIVTELLDQRNQPLAANIGAREILITPELASNYMVQVVKDPLRGRVYQQLLGPEGAEIYVRPASGYIPADRPKASYDELVATARSRGETMLGYFEAHRGEGEAMLPPRLLLNPRRRDLQRPVAEYDRMVVLAFR